MASDERTAEKGTPIPERQLRKVKNAKKWTKKRKIRKKKIWTRTNKIVKKKRMVRKNGKAKMVRVKENKNSRIKRKALRMK